MSGPSSRNRRWLAPALAASLLAAGLAVAPAVRAADPPPNVATLTWGANYAGELGASTDTTAWATPGPPVALPDNVVAVAAGSRHAMALTASGDVWSWGANGSGQLGHGTTTDNPTPTKVADVSGAVAIEASENNSFVVKADGSVLAWGDNGTGKLGDGTTTSRASPTGVHIPSGTRVAAVSAGEAHTLAVTDGGAVLAWGGNGSGQLGDGTTTSNNEPQTVAGLSSGVQKVAAGRGHSLALKSDGTVWAWGANSDGQLGRGHTKSGAAERIPQPVVGLNGVTDLAAASAYSLAVKPDGSVVRWGSGPEMGIGDYPNDAPTSTAVAVDGLVDVVALAAGPEHSLARRRDGSLWAWGNNILGARGRLGTGSPEPNIAPEPVIGLHAAVTAMDAGLDFNVASTQAPQAAPVKPAPPAVTAVAGLNRVKVSWRLVDAGRSPVTSYRVTASAQDGSPALHDDGTPVEVVTTSGPVQNADFTGLANGRAYIFAVTATNAVGTSEPGLSSPVVPGTGVYGVDRPSGYVGSPVYVNGSGFTGATKVTFGGVDATFTRPVTNDGQLSAVAPEHVPGPVDVIVTSPTGTSAPNAHARFTYAKPLLERLDPSAGPSHGGTTVKLTGESFLNVTAVRFGDLPATFFRVDSVTQITAGVPAQRPSGPVSVAVITSDGPVAVASARPALFLYLDGNWLPPEALEQPRIGHTATLLGGAACHQAAPPGYCGKVLVAGGGLNVDLTSGTGSRTAELYDPATGTWTLTGEMNQGRFGHTATLLPSGKVLVSGGVSDAGCTFTGCTRGTLASAELYDPAKGTWTPTQQPMSAPRERHTASLLPQGRVLVTGGDCVAAPFGGCQVLNTAEIYDSSTDSWTPAPAMAHRRKDHIAITLSSGTVLVAGGSGDTGSNTSAEVFDPNAVDDAHRWTATGSSRYPIEKSVATLLPSSTLDVPAKVMVVSRSCGDDPQSFCGPTPPEIYDPATGTWTRTSRPAGAVGPGRTATTLASGQVLVTGGAPAQFETLGSTAAQVYVPTADRWYAIDPTAHPRNGATAVLLPATPDRPSGVLVIGGSGQGNPITDPDAPSSSEVFRDDVTRPPKISAIDPPAGPAGHETSVTITGHGLYPVTSVTVGGHPATVKAAGYSRLVVTVPAQLQRVADVIVTTSAGSSPPGEFTYAAGDWEEAPPLQSREAPPLESGSRFLQAEVLLDPPACKAAIPPADYPCGKVLVAGGTINRNFAFPNGTRSSAELYDPATGRWKITGSMNMARYDFTATLLNDGRVLAAGGRPGDPKVGALRMAETFDPRTEKWTIVDDPMTQERQAHTATLLDDGSVLVTGGTTDENRVSLATAEVFNPNLNVWTPVAKMNEARQLHTATRLANGDVLVTGGLNLVTNTPGTLNVPSKTAEIFHVPSVGGAPVVAPPGAGSWTTVNPLTVARYSHSATLLNEAPCGNACGKVLVVGGYDAESNRFGLASAELYDPVTGNWEAAAVPGVPRGGHSATLLDDGKVLVAGRGYSIWGTLWFPTTARTELYDPLEDRWSNTSSLSVGRGLHTAVALNGPPCRTASPPEWCHSVLAVGGRSVGSGLSDESYEPGEPLSSAELYTSVPRVASLVPATSPASGGTEVVIAGHGFSPSSAVSFGGIPAASVAFDSTTVLRAVSPRHEPAKVEIAVTNATGSSGHDPPVLEVPFTFEISAVPAQVKNLVATPVSDAKVALNFAAPPDDSEFPEHAPPAKRYIVKQSQTPITNDAAFDAASSICPAVGCLFNPPEVGAVLSLEVKDLEPATTYYYAVAAVNDIGRGPASVPASATTLEAPPLATGCSPAPAAAVGQVAYPGGRYSLVGLPAGTQVQADAPLYSWLDLGAGGSYSAASAPASVTAGQGYWAWFKCPKVVDLAVPAGTNVTLPLGEYHASMVGNPTSGPATVTGHDFAAAWDPALNGGAGGYRVSGYRESQTLAVGSGTWVFSYMRTEIQMSGQG